MRSPCGRWRFWVGPAVDDLPCGRFLRGHGGSIRDERRVRAGSGELHAKPAHRRGRRGVAWWAPSSAAGLARRCSGSTSRRSPPSWGAWRCRPRHRRPSRPTAFRFARCSSSIWRARAVHLLLDGAADAEKGPLACNGARLRAARLVEQLLVDKPPSSLEIVHAAMIALARGRCRVRGGGALGAGTLAGLAASASAPGIAVRSLANGRLSVRHELMFANPRAELPLARALREAGLSGGVRRVPPAGSSSTPVQQRGGEK